MAALNSEVGWLRSQKPLLEFILASRTYGKGSLDSFQNSVQKTLKKNYFSYLKQDYQLRRDTRVKIFHEREKAEKGNGKKTGSA